MAQIVSSFVILAPFVSHRWRRTGVGLVIVLALMRLVLSADAAVRAGVVAGDRRHRGIGRRCSRSGVPTSGRPWRRCGGAAPARGLAVEAPRPGRRSTPGAHALLRRPRRRTEPVRQGARRRRARRRPAVPALPVPAAPQRRRRAAVLVAAPHRRARGARGAPGSRRRCPHTPAAGRRRGRRRLVPPGLRPDRRPLARRCRRRERRPTTSCAACGSRWPCCGDTASPTATSAWPTCSSTTTARRGSSTSGSARSPPSTTCSPPTSPSSSRRSRSRSAPSAPSPPRSRCSGPRPWPPASARLQPAALSGATRPASRQHKGLLDEVRAEIESRCGVDDRRSSRSPVRRQTIFTLVMLAAVFYFLIPQLADLPGIVDQIKDANWAWLAPVLVMSALTYLGATLASRARPGPSAGRADRSPPRSARRSRARSPRPGSAAWRSTSGSSQRSGVDTAVATSAVGPQRHGRRSAPTSS